MGSDRRRPSVAARPRQARLSRGALKAAGLFDDRRHFPGADALHVHLVHGKNHRPLAANSPIEGLGVEVSAIPVVVAAGLRDPQIELSDAGVERLGLEAACVALTTGALRDSALSTCSRPTNVSQFMSEAKALASGPCSIARSTRLRNTRKSSEWAIDWFLGGVEELQPAFPRWPLADWHGICA